MRCFFQIIQWNADYLTNFVFGIGTRDDRLIKEDGRWVFHKLTVNAWTAVDQIPWNGERTCRCAHPTSRRQRIRGRSTSRRGMGGRAWGVAL